MKDLGMKEYWERLQDNVPAEIRDRKIWAFAMEDAKGVAKRPLAVLKNRSNVSEKWRDKELVDYHTLSDLMDVYYSSETVQQRVKGAGIVLDGKQGFCVFDGDKKEHASEEDLMIVDELTGYIKDRTYTEKSYGGGTHAFVKTDKVVDGSEGMIEVFSKNRFMAITGDKIGSAGHVDGDEGFIETLWDIVVKEDVAQPLPKSNKRSKNDASIEDVKSILSIIDNSNSDDYDRWIKIGMAVHATMGGTGEAMDAWASWSAKGASAGKNTNKECLEKWNTFNPPEAKMLHASWGTLLYEAKENTTSLTLSKMIEDCKDDELVKLYKHAKQLLFPENNANSDKNVDPVGAMLDSLPDVCVADYPILNGAKKEVLPEYRNLRYLCETAGIEIRQNMMTKNVEVIFPGDNKNIVPYVGNHSVQMVKQYAAISAMNHRDSMFDDSIHVLAQYNQYHPVEKLLKEQKWDGVSRMDVIMDSVHVADKFKDIWPTYWRCFCYSVINRILSYRQPESHRGCLVFAGPQGCGKSTFFKEIVNFGDDLPNTFNVMGNPREILHKDTIMAFQSLMLCEIAEFDSIISRSEASDAKQMLTRHEDTYRAPYARQTETHPRTVTIVGTTNALTFLNDGSGSTRFNVVSVEKIDLEALEGCNVLEFWREALHCYNEEIAAGNTKPWQLPERFWEDSSDLNSGFQQEEPTIEAWHEFVYAKGWTPENVKKAVQQGTVEPVNLQRIYVMIEQKFNAKATYRSDLIRAVNETLGHERRKHNGMKNSWLVPWLNGSPRPFINNDTENVPSNVKSIDSNVDKDRIENVKKFLSNRSVF